MYICIQLSQVRICRRSIMRSYGELGDELWYSTSNKMSFALNALQSQDSQAA